MARFFAVVIAFAAISSAGAASTCMRGEIAPTAGFCQGSIYNMRHCAPDYGTFQSDLLALNGIYEKYTDPSSVTSPIVADIITCEATLAAGCAAANVTTKTGTDACGAICNGIASCTTDDDCPEAEPVVFKDACCSKCEEALAAGCNGPATGRDGLTQAEVTAAISAVRAPASARYIDGAYTGRLLRASLYALSAGPETGAGG